MPTSIGQALSAVAEAMAAPTRKERRAKRVEEAYAAQQKKNQDEEKRRRQEESYQQGQDDRNARIINEQRLLDEAIRDRKLAALVKEREDRDRRAKALKASTEAAIAERNQILRDEAVRQEKQERRKRAAAVLNIQEQNLALSQGRFDLSKVQGEESTAFKEQSAARAQKKYERLLDQDALRASKHKQEQLVSLVQALQGRIDKFNDVGDVTRRKRKKALAEGKDIHADLRRNLQALVDASGSGDEPVIATILEPYLSNANGQEPVVQEQFNAVEEPNNLVQARSQPGAAVGETLERLLGQVQGFKANPIPQTAENVDELLERIAVQRKLQTLLGLLSQTQPPLPEEQAPQTPVPQTPVPPQKTRQQQLRDILSDEDKTK